MKWLSWVRLCDVHGVVRKIEPVVVEADTRSEARAKIKGVIFTRPKKERLPPGWELTAEPK